MNQQARTQLEHARTRLLLKFPFFGTLAMRLGLHEDTTIPTLATDGRKMFYNPEFVLARLDRDTSMSAVSHEVGHCILEHCSRRGQRNPGKWNRATDYSVNDMLKQAGFVLGDTWLWDTKYQGMTEDKIYSLLPDQPGDGEGEALCDVRDAKDDDAIRAEWQGAVVQAANATRGRGKLPSQVEVFIKEILAPAVPWQERLARFMTEKTKDDYSWSRPNKFFIQSGTYIPSLDGVGMGEVVIGLDTSGSVISVLDEFGAHVQNILAAANPLRIHLVYCDARVNHVRTFERGEAITFEAVGGGGTAFEPVFDWVSEQSIRPAALLYLTDMYGSFPDQAPDYPTIWCSTTERYEAPFGETIYVGE